MRDLVAVLTLAAAVLVAAVTGVSPAAAMIPPMKWAEAETPYSVLQMNLCLSGYASCYPKTAYPAVVDEAAEEVDDRQLDAVTLNEACRADAIELARRTGLHLRFSAVRVAGAPLPCVNPRGRGVFGLAVLTHDPLTESRDEGFLTHDGSEERGWLCVTTVRSVTVCTAHLATRGSVDGRRANDAECAELRGILARYHAVRTTVFAGDVNRRRSCSPVTMWTVRDTAVHQNPGIQHIYGSGSLMKARSEVKASMYTDHPFLAATACSPRHVTAVVSAGPIRCS